MSKTVILSLGSGSLSAGFSHVVVQVWETKESKPIKSFGQLPIAVDIVDLYKHWQASYLAIYQPVDSCRIRYEDAGLNHLSGLSFDELRQSLSLKINAWLNSEPFRNVDQQLRKLLSADDEIEFIIETGDRLLRRLPWHLWEFFKDYPKAEVALSAPKYERSNQELIISPGTQVRILAVFGDKEGIDLKKDLTLLKKLSSQSDIKILTEPPREKLYEQIEEGWHILFFAGHSYSKEKGIIQLNKTDNLSLDELANSLEKAISKGLKLAIFNSCDGLGLAEALTDLHIPQVIVMKEPVPDVVAQEFLKTFLKAFSNGQSLCASVHEGRKSLQKLEFRYPCATWLPVVFRNPSEKAITWQDLCGQVEGNTILDNGRRQQNRQNFFGSRRRLLQAVLISSVAVTALVMGVRYLGWLQSVELIAFDQTMRLRSQEDPDPRLLIVTVTEGDLKLPEERERKGSLPDLALAPLLRKLEQYDPVAIGLDAYRDFAVGPFQSDLLSRMKKQENLFVVCKGSDAKAGNPGISPPPEVEVKEQEYRQGFSDIVLDPDNVLRRYLLSIAPSVTSPCTAPSSLSAQLASAYLSRNGISGQYDKRSGEFQLGKTVFKRLRPHMGPYQQVDTHGYQFLLNYRSPVEIAPTITLTDVLSNKVKKIDKSLKQRIILVGSTATSVHDYLATPYGQMPGVMAQAQMVSQILSAVSDDRPLLWFWPAWAEYLWVFGWSLLGGVLILICRSAFQFGLAIAILELCLFGACLGLLNLTSFWVPLVPSAIALVVTSGTVVFVNNRISNYRQGV